LPGKSYTNAYSYSYSYVYANSYGDRDGNGNAAAYANTEAASHSGTAPVTFIQFNSGEEHRAGIADEKSPIILRRVRNCSTTL
jgi:hypothetical protein